MSYTSSSNFNDEFSTSNSKKSAATPPKDTKIIRAAIHPSIGVARVGNSVNEYFIGPEVTVPILAKPNSSRDKTGALKRQAARFRIYGYNAMDEVISEITSDDADIVWNVHVANKKASWFRFMKAMDIPEAVTTNAILRNAKITNDHHHPDARHDLTLDPGIKSISGKDTQGEQYHFLVSKFAGTSVSIYLGELRTDKHGHLIFLGGRGVSDSPTNSPIYDSNDPDSFTNADGWYDDTSDGPVTANVTINGEEIPVDGAWVITTPPDYARDVVAIRTMYDLLYDTYVQAGLLPFPKQISFTKHIFPILYRLKNLQWVNKGFAAKFGYGTRYDFENKDYLDKLAKNPNPCDTYKELRLQILNSFRDPNAKNSDPLPWPWIYGDAMKKDPFANSPRQNMSLSLTQYRFLQLWADGSFVSDWNSDEEIPHVLDDVPISDQPSMLDQASLHFCLADAFHPGCELTWPMRHASMYMTPFRIKPRPDGQPEPDYGATLTQEIALQPGGPLYSQGPGDLTRWMSIPWQADTISCRSGYAPEYDPYLPTFWPAKVPNQILTKDDYNIVMNTTLPREDRIDAFLNREHWTRQIKGKGSEAMKKMVKDFPKMGVIETYPGIPTDPDFPSVMMVESLSAFEQPLPLTKYVPVEVEPKPMSESERRLRRFIDAGWESEEVANSFRDIVE